MANKEAPINVAIGGLGYISGGITLLLTEEQYRINKYLKQPFEIKQIFVKDIDGSTGLPNAAEINADRRAGILKSGEYWPAPSEERKIKAKGDCIEINGKLIELVRGDIRDEGSIGRRINPEIEVFFEGSGILDKVEKVKKALKGVKTKKGLIYLATYVVKDGDDGSTMPIYIEGITEQGYKPTEIKDSGDTEVVDAGSNISCTGKAGGEIVHVVIEAVAKITGVKKPTMVKSNAVHGDTPSQELHAKPSIKDPRKSRRAPDSIIPGKTNAKEGFAKLFAGVEFFSVFPSYRVDEKDGSFVDMYFFYPSGTKITAREIKDAFIKEAEEKSHVVAYTEDEITSEDIRQSTKAVVVDGSRIEVVHTPVGEVIYVPGAYAHAHGPEAQVIYVAQSMEQAKRQTQWYKDKFTSSDSGAFALQALDGGSSLYLPQK
jgi:hypothetical protein